MLGQRSLKNDWKSRAYKLFADSSYWHRQSNSRDVVIRKQGKQIDDATSLAYRLRVQRDSLRKQSDKSVDILSAKQQQIAYYRALVDNQTLNPIYLVDTVYSASRDSAITSAGLKTARREEIAQRTLDSMEISIAAREARISALKQERDRARNATVNAQQILLDESTRKRPFGIGRKRAMIRGAKQVQAIREGSELEDELNPDTPR